MEKTAGHDRKHSPVFRPFLIILLCSIAVIAVSMAWLAYRQSKIYSEELRLSLNLQKTIALNQEMMRGIEQQVNALYLYLRDPREELFHKFEHLNFSVADNQNRYLALDIGLDERFIVERIKTFQAELGLEANHVFERVRNGDRPGALGRMIEVEHLENRIHDFMGQLNSFQVHKLRSVADDMIGVFTRTYHVVFSFALILLGVLMIFAFMLRRRIAHPLRSLLEAATEIRAGNFSARCPVKRNDEIGRLAEQFNFMAESLAASYSDLESKIEDRTRQLRGLQEQLIQSEKMSAVGELVSGVAHELNNPLTAIVGNAELVRDSLGSSSEDASRGKKLDVIFEQARRCSRIVANLLQFARQRETDLVAMKFNAVVKQALQFREYELNTRNIILEQVYDPADPVIMCDPSKIQQVVLVLLNNAVDAIRDQGESGTILVRVRSTEDKVELEVRDDGTGIADPERVFDPFYTTKEVGKGTGLGLSVCYGIALEHMGEMRAENWEHGARFILSLPPAPEGRDADESEPRQAGELPRLTGRALIVDDEKAVAVLQLSILADLGMEGEIALSGEDAMRYLDGGSVDLVITDIRMPGTVDGIMLYEWIEEHRPDLAGKVLFISGDPAALSEFGHGKLPAPCIRKPFTTEEYARTVEQIMIKPGSRT